MPARPNIVAALFNDEGWLLINFKVSASLENLFKNHLRSPLMVSKGFLCFLGWSSFFPSPTHRPLESGVAVCHPTQHHTANVPWDVAGQVQSISVSPDRPVTPQEEGRSVMMKAEDGNDGWMGHKWTARRRSPLPHTLPSLDWKGKEVWDGGPVKVKTRQLMVWGGYCQRETYDRVKAAKVGGRLSSWYMRPGVAFLSSKNRRGTCITGPARPGGQRRRSFCLSLSVCVCVYVFHAYSLLTEGYIDLNIWNF